MKKCNKCKKEYEDGIYCPFCGNRLEDIKNSGIEISEVCPNCGYKNNPYNAKFCVNCGCVRINIKSGTKILAIKNGDFNKKVRITSYFVQISIIVLLIIALGINFINRKNEIDLIMDASRNSSVALSKNKTLSFLSNVLSKGSIEINTSQMPIFGVNGVTKVYFDNTRRALTFSGNIFGVNCNNNMLYSDTKEIIAKLPVIFGDNIYGITEENLEGSWIMSLLKETDVKAYRIIKNSFNNNTEIDKNVLQKELRQIFLDFEKTIKKVYKRNIEFYTENEEVLIGEKNIKALKVSANIEIKQAKKILIEVLNWAKNYKELESFTQKYPMIVSNVLVLYNNKNGDAEYMDYTPDELYNQIIDLFNFGIDKINNFDGNEKRANIQYYISKKTNQLVKFALDELDSSFKLVIVVCEDWEKFDNLLIESGGVELLSYTVNSDANEYIYNIDVGGENFSKLNWNMDEGDFVLGRGNTNITGNLKYGDKAVIEISNVSESNDWTSYDVALNLTCVLSMDDKFIEKPEKYKDILNMSQMEVLLVGQEIFERINDKFGFEKVLGSIFN